MKKMLLMAIIGISASSAFAEITANMTAQPYPAAGSHHNKIYVTSEHDATVLNNGGNPVTFTITYKVCEDNECYSAARPNVTVAAYSVWHDHAKIQTSKKYRAPGLYKSYAITQIDSADYKNKVDAFGNINVA